MQADALDGPRLNPCHAPSNWTRSVTYLSTCPDPQASSASGRVAKASDGRSNATGRPPSTNGTSRLDVAVGSRSAAAASVGGSAARSAVGQADAPGAGLAAADLLVNLEGILGAA
jgi:hypothetical protein